MAHTPIPRPHSGQPPECWGGPSHRPAPWGHHCATGRALTQATNNTGDRRRGSTSCALPAATFSHHCSPGCAVALHNASAGQCSTRLAAASVLFVQLLTYSQPQLLSKDLALPLPRVPLVLSLRSKHYSSSIGGSQQTSQWDCQASRFTLSIVTPCHSHAM